MVDEVSKVAATVTAETAKVETFWSKYGSRILYVLAVLVGAYLGHKL